VRAAAAMSASTWLTYPTARPVADRRVRSAIRVPVAWPLAGLLCLFPLWWALGLGNFALVIAAVPMTAQLVRRGHVKVPPGFGIWLMFLAWTVASTALLNVNPTGTVPSTASHRVIAVSFRVLQLLADTVALLYVVNLGGDITRRQVMRWMDYLCITTIAGGILGILSPTFQFTSLVEVVLPSHLASNSYVHSLVHPAAAEVQNVLGFSSPRPSAPFTFTNTWGNCLTILLIWYVVGTLSSRGYRRLIRVAVIAAAVVPITYSLNRGMWLGLLAIIVYVIARLAAHGHRRLLAASVAIAMAGIAIFFVSPLHSTVSQRLSHGQSNSIRALTDTKTIETLGQSPIIGFGSSRLLQGSGSSITIGPSAACPRCGNPVLGSNGELWLDLMASGVVGGLLYLAFFGQAIVRFWRDRSAIGYAGVAVMALMVGYSVIYNAAGVPLLLGMLSMGLLWMNRASSTDPPGLLA
jgi:hypothetical protein